MYFDLNASGTEGVGGWYGKYESVRLGGGIGAWARDRDRASELLSEVTEQAEKLGGTVIRDWSTS